MPSASFFGVPRTVLPWLVGTGVVRRGAARLQRPPAVEWTHLSRHNTPPFLLSSVYACMKRRVGCVTMMITNQPTTNQPTNQPTNDKPPRSKINLVDLAGSEKWKPHQLTAFSTKRIQEMTSINKSLSNLGNCVRALTAGQRHIPYRNSKLTRLLADSLGGNTRTVGRRYNYQCNIKRQQVEYMYCVARSITSVAFVCLPHLLCMSSACL